MMLTSKIVFLLLSASKYAVAASPSCPAGTALSCQNTTIITDTCCTEVQGQVLQVQFWDTDPATGPSDSWTVHGLWYAVHLETKHRLY